MMNGRPDFTPLRMEALHQRDAGWTIAAALSLAAIIGLIVLHWDVVLFTAHTWSSNETFTHGFLIFPISGYLIWKRRLQLAQLTPRPVFWPLLVVLMFTAIWELGYLARVMILQQYALVGMIIMSVWATLGTRVVREIAFPLAFLLFAVPVGEMLLPPLMEFTADFTVTALQLTGIPVYREGNFFSIPSGNWSVVEACSGLRYLIASLTLGLLYAYMTYRSFWRRAIFVALSVIVPLLANGIRAYMIVMLGHLSDMRIAVGVDHLIYGWLFFGLVMLLLFWAGSFWREDDQAEDHPRQRAAEAGAPASLNRIATTAVLVIAVAAIGPVHAHLLEKKTFSEVELALPLPADGWRPTPQPLANWEPHFLGSKVSRMGTYQNGEREAMLYLGYFRDQEQGSELIQSQNVVVSTTNRAWGNIGESDRRVRISGSEIPVRQTLLRGPGTRLVVWHWYWVDGHFEANPYRVKYLGALSKFRGRGDDAAVVVVAAPYQDRPEEALPALQSFAEAMLPGIRDVLDRAVHANTTTSGDAGS